MKTANIFLIGFMGTGKSTVSKQLSLLLGREEADTDQILEEREQRKVSDIFASFGEPYFREKETALVKEFEEKGGYVVSCGGGIVLREENVASMKRSGIIVWLTATPETVYERVRHSRSRPLLNGHMDVGYIAGLMEARDSFYRDAADLVVATDQRTPLEIAEEIVKKM